MTTTCQATTRYEAWKQFHEENPHVYALFKRFAAEAKARRDRFSARVIWERMRWYTSIETADDYKLNNNHAPYYARLLMLEDPAYEGFLRAAGFTV